MRTIQTFNFSRPEIAGYKALRIRRDTDWNEYVVEFIFAHGEVDNLATYCTDNKQDAIDTAEFELKRMEAKK